MARDLTHNRGGYAYPTADTPPPENPFESEHYYSSSHSSEGSRQQYDPNPGQALLSHNSSESFQGRPTRGYTYIPGTSTTTHRDNHPFTPPEYDRYPSRGNSRVTSQQSVGSASYIAGVAPRTRGDSFTDSLSSSHRQSFFENGDVDFSPFGGYPALAFPLHIDEKEEDDYLHNPDPIADAEYDKNRFKYDMKHLDRRSLCGLLGFIVLALGALCLFVLYPVLTYSGVLDPWKPQSYVILSDYKYPTLAAIRTLLVDPDTPTEYLTRTADDGSDWNLVFSDEFNAEGRTFYEGDDQFWYAPDFNYAATKDLEWYDPDAVATANGTLQFTLDAFENHNLMYRSGMLHSWNKMCFTQGIMEVSIRLPNYGFVSGLWPGAWTLGNLGRPGYMATTEGVWPYSYQSCDAGITANQSSPDGISYLPGQKLNACTCNGGDHPNKGVGRGAPEIDVIEAAMDTKLGVGVASQSVQIAPFDIWYMPDYNQIEVYNFLVTNMNTYAGGPFQQAVSGVTTLNVDWYERSRSGINNFQNYAFEYLNDPNTGYIKWFVGNDPTFKVVSNAFAPNGNIGWRPILKEPMSLVVNLGLSNSWAYIDWGLLKFPMVMEIDYVRVYQPANATNIGCDPVGYPTSNYIQQHLNAYSDYNLTSWEMAGYTFPKNRLTGC
ncbi:glycoside hydrolase family 16 protein [Babjeviella inositovora NRRL Y-12698]|uniref:Glycoside hydrolase family 16 protein n=1 Tax=Babjeviella inositovora NRRL Y-12698 TaxID=984486 RepID=A0A1E3QJ71_9ASCO|nr:glycoside hydrolase family 16 protein [Babjeviella inositovora NRRL Y-12698]ODQ77763.1 glycoside hydrolase family 16 protein [Babjeviella inositovora NRRL Y-12698]